MVQKIMNMRFIIYKVSFGDVTHLYTKKSTTLELVLRVWQRKNDPSALDSDNANAYLVKSSHQLSILI
jgi:hypothetical protein